MSGPCTTLLLFYCFYSERRVCTFMGKKKKKKVRVSARKTSLHFRILFEVFVVTILGSSSIKQNLLIILTPWTDVLATCGRRSRMFSDELTSLASLDCLPPILSHFSKARPHKHSNQAAESGMFYLWL